MYPLSSARISLGSLILLLVACGDSSNTSDPRPRGAASEHDASSEGDAGSEPEPDAGSGVERDAGSGVERDAGSGVEPDAGSGVEPDAGSELDAGSEPEPDAAVEPPDAGQPVPVNIIENGSFEAWSGTLPDHWFGSATNIDASGVAKVTPGAYDGANALRLTNELNTHKRFTTQGISLSAGSYTCTYQVRGTGEVRNAFFATDYSSYSVYTTLGGGQGWQKVDYAFNLAQDVVDTFQLIFSIRNTSGEHLLIDNVRCVKPL